jgi:hypothetical protein
MITLNIFLNHYLFIYFGGTGVLSPKSLLRCKANSQDTVGQRKYSHSKREECSYKKEDQNLVGQTLNPVAPCPAPGAQNIGDVSSKGLERFPPLMSFPVVPQEASLIGWL